MRITSIITGLIKRNSTRARTAMRKAHKAVEASRDAAGRPSMAALVHYEQARAEFVRGQLECAHA